MVISFFIINLFIFGCIGSLLLRTSFLQLRRVGASLCCGAQVSHCSGFSCYGAQSLGVRASVVVARGLSSCGSRALEHRFSSCGARAQVLRGMWDLSRPGLEPVSPALAGRFLTTAPPGKPGYQLFDLEDLLYGRFVRSQLSSQTGTNCRYLEAGLFGSFGIIIFYFTKQPNYLQSSFTILYFHLEGFYTKFLQKLLNFKYGLIFC